VAFPETYSQGDEQQAILKYFAHFDRGKFLDIGAWHPKTFSNTRALYELGWAGTMIEPSPAGMLAQLKEYGYDQRVTLIQGAVGLEDLLQVFEMTDDCVSSSDFAHLAKYKDERNPNHANFYGRAWVRMITWPQINSWFGGFDFVNLDAEGISVDLFHSMLNSGAKPPCVCVEFDQRMAELSAAATAVGYKLIYSNGTNGVFAL
jgi:hypothetical protein